MEPMDGAVPALWPLPRRRSDPCAGCYPRGVAFVQSLIPRRATVDVSAAREWPHPFDAQRTSVDSDATLRGDEDGAALALSRFVSSRKQPPHIPGSPAPSDTTCDSSASPECFPGSSLHVTPFSNRPFSPPSPPLAPPNSPSPSLSLPFPHHASISLPLGRFWPDARPAARRRRVRFHPSVHVFETWGPEEYERGYAQAECERMAREGREAMIEEAEGEGAAGEMAMVRA